MEYRNTSLVILGVVAAIIWSLDYWKIWNKVQIRLPAVSGAVQAQQASWQAIRAGIFVLGIIAWGYISFALMGPREAKSYSPSDIEVNDIFIVFDVSRSMLADDLPPNRLEVAKQKFKEFAAMRPTDRIGVIIFSEEVFTLLPLTTDPSLVEKIIGDIKIGFLGSGTNIGDAIGLAVARAIDSATKNKVIILMTDGVSNTGNLTPMQAAEKARDYNIKIYTVGVGTDDSARIPIGQTAFGTRYQTIPGGSIDFAGLEEIAKMTGGKAYAAKSEGALAEVLNEIQQLEKTKIQSQSQIIYKELFFNYLLIGVLILSLVELLRKLWMREIL